jgi:hypothetical protein
MEEAKAKDTSSVATLAVLKEKARCTRFMFPLSPLDTDRLQSKPMIGQRNPNR